MNALEKRQLEKVTGMKLPTLSGDELPVNTLTKKKFLEQISSTLTEYANLELTPEQL